MYCKELTEENEEAKDKKIKTKDFFAFCLTLTKTSNEVLQFSDFRLGKVAPPLPPLPSPAEPTQVS